MSHALTCRSHEPNGFCTCSVGVLRRLRFDPPHAPHAPWSEPVASPEAVREGVAYLKRCFLGYKIPPVELPADSVIEDVVRYILGLNANRA